MNQAILQWQYPSSSLFLRYRRVRLSSCEQQRSLRFARGLSSIRYSQKNPSDLAKAEQSLMMGLSSLYAVAENYPELKANQNFMDLQKELSQIEDTIQQARTQYNKVVSRFNTAVQQFPRNLIAGILGFNAFEFFDAPDEANQLNVKI